MASTSTSTSFIQTFDPFHKINTTRSIIVKPRSRSGTLRISAIKREAHDHDSRGRVVDENMIVLRKRIHEMKVIEAESELPREWMDWEKRVYESYDGIICDAVGHLQSYLMETRPSFVLGVLVLLALSVPTSTTVVMSNLLGFGNAVLSGIIH